MKAIHLFVATCVPNPIPVIRGRISCLLGEGERGTVLLSIDRRPTSVVW